MINFLNNDDGNDVTKTATLPRTLCDVVLHHKDVPTVQHVIQTKNVLNTTIYLSFVMLSASFLALYYAYPFMDSSRS